MAKLTRKHRDFGAIGKQAAESDTVERPMIVGRYLQHDTDFTCYRVAANKDESIETCIKRVLSIVNTARIQAGAEHANMHLTVGLKSGRKEMATVEPYQEKRNKKSDPELAYRVEQIREGLARSNTAKLHPVVSRFVEADDTIRVYQEKRIAEFGPKSSVTQSGDKDLWFTFGEHMADDGSIYNVDGYGFVEYREVGNVKPKLIGEGTSWFWHQMIMGDSVDNIPGLPKIDNRTLDLYMPLKGGKARKAGTASCGEAKAYAMLKDIKDDYNALVNVWDAYVTYWGKARAKEMFVEQAFLLWIRKTNKLTDVLDFLNSITGAGTWKFTEAQKERLRGYQAEVKRLQELPNG